MSRAIEHRLGELLTRMDRFEHKDDATEYQFAGTYSYGRGIFVGDRKIGGSFGLPKVQRIRANDFVYCKIMAWEGAFGIVPQEADNCVLSGAFVAYQVDDSRLLPQFLGHMFKAPSIWKRIGNQSTGTNVRRKSLHPSQLENTFIELPNLAKQQAIVARLDALAEKTRQLEANLTAADNASTALLLSLHYKLGSDRKVRLGDVIELYEVTEPIRIEGQYPQVGVRGFGGGLFAKSATAGSDTAYKSFNRLYTDAVVLSQVKGWEGAIALCPAELDGMFVSPEYRTFRCKPTEASPSYLGELFRTEWFWSQLQEATRGVGARRERTRPEQFLNIQLPMPELMDQLKIAEILAKQVPLKAKHAAIRKANAALLPATLERLFA